MSLAVESMRDRISAFESPLSASRPARAATCGVAMLVPFGDQPALEELRAALKEERDCRVLLRNYKKDGTPFWNELSVSPVRDEGERLRNFIGVQNDVTRRKTAEEALRRARDELENRVRQRTARLAEANARLRGEISERRELEARLTHQAFHDSLTGLPNRTLFLDRLDLALERAGGRGAGSRCCSRTWTTSRS